MFNNNPIGSKTEQVSEQVFQPIRIPVIIGNDAYIVTQQDIRNIVETRYVSCIKCPNGIKDLQEFFAQESINMAAQQQQNPRQPVNNNTLPQYIDLVNQATALAQCHCAQNMQPGTVNTRPPQNRPHVAPIGAQIDWETRNCLAERPDSFTYGKKTSTTDLQEFTCKTDTNKNINPRPIVKILISKGMNACAADILEEIEQQKMETDPEPPTAQEQLKLKKERDCKRKL